MTSSDFVLPEFRVESLGRRLCADLRSDHAGETGAVGIYKGMLAVSRDAELRVFAVSHLATEEQHLALLDGWVPPASRSRLLPLWSWSGWMLGALAGLGGRRFAYVTINAVEQFVTSHYEEQLPRAQGEVRRLIRALQDDEAQHQEDAERRAGEGRLNWVERCWSAIVWRGSSMAVALARML